MLSQIVDVYLLVAITFQMDATKVSSVFPTTTVYSPSCCNFLKFRMFSEVVVLSPLVMSVMLKTDPSTRVVKWLYNQTTVLALKFEISTLRTVLEFSRST